MAESQFAHHRRRHMTPANMGHFVGNDTGDGVGIVRFVEHAVEQDHPAARQGYCIDHIHVDEIERETVCARRRVQPVEQTIQDGADLRAFAAPGGNRQVVGRSHLALPLHRHATSQDFRSEDDDSGQDRSGSSEGDQSCHRPSAHRRSQGPTFRREKRPHLRFDGLGEDQAPAFQRAMAELQLAGGDIQADQFRLLDIMLRPIKIDQLQAG